MTIYVRLCSVYDVRTSMLRYVCMKCEPSAIMNMECLSICFFPFWFCFWFVCPSAQTAPASSIAWAFFSIIVIVVVWFAAIFICVYSNNMLLIFRFCWLSCVVGAAIAVGVVAVHCRYGIAFLLIISFFFYCRLTPPSFHYIPFHLPLFWCFYNLVFYL